MPRPDLTIATKVTVIRRERAARKHSLEQIEGEGAPKQISLEGAELSIGRATDADVCVPSPRASRQHAFLSRRGTEFMLRDNDSNNGIYLNGLRIHSAVLRDGDVIQIADSAFIYREN